MAIESLKINGNKSVLGIEKNDPTFSFRSDSPGPFEAKLLYQGKIIGEKRLSHAQLLAFRFGIILKQDSEYCLIVSDSVSEKSVVFETEINFNACMICPEKDSLTAPTLYRCFTVGFPVKKARLFITGLGLYRAFINQKRVGRDYLTPGFNDYDAYLRYQTYDVTDLVCVGENRIDVCMGDGWYKGRFGSHEGMIGSEYRLAAKLTVTSEDGTVQDIYTDPDWKVESSGCGENSIYDGENRDFRAAGLPCGGCRRTVNSYHIIPELNAPLRERQILHPTLIYSPAGEQILDFGQNMVGFVRFSGKYPAGTVIHLEHGEVLQNGCFFRENMRSAKAQATYISDGSDRIYGPYFTFFGFRYVRVEGIEISSTCSFEGVVISSELDETISCITGNEKLNRLILNARWGQRGNFIDTPIDCPQRDERKGWTGDAQVFSATACYQADCRAFYRKYCRDLREDQQRYYNGDLPLYSPTMHEMPRPGGAVWADAATVIPWNVYTFYGDLAQLQAVYPMMRDYTETLIGRSCEEHTLMLNAFTIGDWLAQDGADPQSCNGGTDKNFILCCYYYYSVSLTGKAAKTLGLTADAERYTDLATRIRNATVRRFFTKTGDFTLDTQAAYVLALKFGFYSEKSRLIEQFRQRLQKDDNRVMTGFTGTPLILPAMFENGLEQEAFSMLLREEYPGWLYCVNLGATTIWERWNSLLPDGTVSGTEMNSFNHYAFGSVCEAIYGNIAGLRPDTPGWTSALIVPHFDRRLGFIDCSYCSVQGTYRSAWYYEKEGSVRFEWEIPEGCRARVVLPGQEEFEIGPGKTERIWRKQ